MKVTKLNDELKQMGLQQLRDMLEQLRAKLFSMKLKAKTAHIKNYAEFTLLRRHIARVLTFIKQKELQGATQ